MTKRLPRGAALLAVFVLGALAGVGLWRFWTPRCNEACNPDVALGMQAFAVLLPWVGLASAAVLFALPARPRVKVALGAVGLAVLSLGAVWLTRAAG